MQRIIVDLCILADEYVKRYKASDAVVHTYSRDGRSVQFPASILQPYVTHAGVKGSFCINFDKSGKFSAIEQLSV